MSNQSNSFSSPLPNETVKTIDQLNLPMIQKHHVRLLAHCLAIFKQIAEENSSSILDEREIKKWCFKQSQKINDDNFHELLFIQMCSAAKKLNVFAETIGKTIQELNLQDLIILSNETKNQSV